MEPERDRGRRCRLQAVSTASVESTSRCRRSLPPLCPPCKTEIAWKTLTLPLLPLLLLLPALLLLRSRLFPS